MGLTGKVTMVMMTLVAFLCRKAHRLCTDELFVLRLSSSQNYMTTYLYNHHIHMHTNSMFANTHMAALSFLMILIEHLLTITNIMLFPFSCHLLFFLFMNMWLFWLTVVALSESTINQGFFFSWFGQAFSLDFTKVAQLLILIGFEPYSSIRPGWSSTRKQNFLKQSTLTQCNTEISFLPSNSYSFAIFPPKFHQLYNLLVCSSGQSKN